ncbi:MAG: universal stress protein [Chloroflexi bacterium]|nr:universal stress protein [Chloroflexota bacterium]
MRILFATDGSPSAETALDMLVALPLRATDHITVLSIPVHSYAGVGFDGTGQLVAEVAMEETATARRIATDALGRITAKGASASILVQEGLPAPTINEIARSDDADLVVLGSRGLGHVAGLILGSTARAVARTSPVPVLVVRDRRTPPRRILIAIDGSDDANAAIRTLAALPLSRNVEITLLHVQAERERPDAATERDERRAAVELFSAARELLPPASGTRLELERGPAAERIVAAASAEGSDLIVLGARGRTAHRVGFLQGSTADRVLENAHCAVLVARAQMPATPAGATGRRGAAATSREGEEAVR